MKAKFLILQLDQLLLHKAGMRMLWARIDLHVITCLYKKRLCSVDVAQLPSCYGDLTPRNRAVMMFRWVHVFSPFKHLLMQNERCVDVSSMLQ